MRVTGWRGDGATGNICANLHACAKRDADDRTNGDDGDARHAYADHALTYFHLDAAPDAYAVLDTCSAHAHGRADVEWGGGANRRAGGCGNVTRARRGWRLL